MGMGRVNSLDLGKLEWYKKNGCYPEIAEWIRNKDLEHFVQWILPDGISVRFPMDLPNREKLVEEFKTLVRRVAKVKSIDEISDYIDVVMTKEFVIDPPLPSDIDARKLLKHIAKWERQSYRERIKGFKKYTIYIVYGGRYKKVHEVVYLKRGKKYLHIAEEVPSGSFMVKKVPLDEVKK